MKNTKNFANKVQNVFDNDGTLNYDNLERDQKINIIKMFDNDYDTEEPPIISKIYIENLLQAYNDAKSGNLQSLKTLVNEKNLNIGFIYGEQKYNLAHLAAADNRTNILEYIKDTNPELLTATDESNETPLDYANEVNKENSHTDVIKFLESK